MGSIGARWSACSKAPQLRTARRDTLVKDSLRRSEDEALPPPPAPPMRDEVIGLPLPLAVLPAAEVDLVRKDMRLRRSGAPSP